jgi:AraC-like DNA-binding protein
MNFFHDQIVFIQEFPYSLTRLVYPNVNSSFSPLTQQTLQIIHSEYASKLKLQDIASRLNIQESYLSRLFKKDTQIFYTDYLIQYRLKRALILMDETSYSVTDIAFMVGFDSSTYFSTCFRKTYQSSPSAYRKSHSS